MKNHEKLLEVIHATASGLNAAGVLSPTTMKEFARSAFLRSNNTARIR